MVIGVTAFALIGHGNSNDDGFAPEIDISRTELMIGEKVYCNVTEIPEERNVTWDFGDGNITFGHSVNHSYQFSDKYTITCIIEDGLQDVAAGVDVFVNNPDYYIEYSGIGLINMRRGWEYRGEGAYLYPGIYQPVVETKVTVSNVIGTVDVGFWFVDLFDQPGGTLYSERHNLMGSDLEFEMIFDGGILPEIIHESVCGIDLELRNGATGNWKIEIWVTYEYVE